MKNYKWFCINKYFDDGSVETSIVPASELTDKRPFVSLRDCDRYCDGFHSLSAAKSFEGSVRRVKGN